MADYRSSGAHQLNKYLWSKLKDFQYDGVNYAFAEYRGTTPTIPLVPIIPTQQIPEFTDISGGAPFIVYNFRENPKGDYWLTRETCSYVVYDPDEDRLRAIKNYISDLFKRWDWAAQNVNSYMSANSVTGFDFKEIHVFTATGPNTATDEGGRQTASIVVSYIYAVDNDGLEGSGLRV